MWTSLDYVCTEFFLAANARGTSILFSFENLSFPRSRAVLGLGGFRGTENVQWSFVVFLEDKNKPLKKNGASSTDSLEFCSISNTALAA